MEPFSKTLIDDLLDNYLNENCKFDEESGELLDDLESDITYDVNNFDIIEEGVDLLDENYPLDEASNNRDLGIILAQNEENNCLNSECTNVQSPSRNKEQINSEQPHKSILGISNAAYSNKSKSIHKVADVDAINNRENQSEKPTDAQCLEYNKQYDNPGSTRYHMEIGVDPEKRFKCAQCDYKCSTLKLLQRHRRKMHANSEQIECSKCNKRFKSIYSCQRHENICGENPNLSCTLCSYKTHWKQDLQRHLKNHEKIYQKTVQNNEASSVALDLLNDNRKHELYSGVSKFQASFQRYCSKCRENFENNSNLNSRKCKTCETKLLMRCIKCKSLHNSVEAIRYHLQHRCSKFECSTCDYITTHRRYLKKHIQQKHAKVDSEQIYKCSKCPSSFLTKQCLKKHIQKSCTSDKPYLLCDHCPFKTKRKSALINHIKSHMASENSVKVCRKTKTTNVESRNDLVDNYLNNYSRFDDESEKSSDKLESDITYDVNNFDIIEEGVDLLDENYPIDENYPTSTNRDLGSILAENQENNCLNSECTNVQSPSRNKEQINSEQPHKSILGISNGTYSNNSNLIHKVADVDTISNKENQSEKPTDAQYLEYNKQYNNLGSMGYHMQIGGDSDKLFKCAQCDYKCSTLKLLQRHRRRMHANSEQIECSKCNKRFKSIYTCQRHEKICGENPNFSCTLCSYKTHWKQVLQRHLKYHEKTFQKTVQDNEASVLLDFLKEQWNSKEKLYSLFQRYCSKCRENFENNLTHNSRKCKKCETKLLMRCIRCNNLYKKVQNIKCHLTKHCILKTELDCPMCNYSTTDISYLKKHIQRKHVKIDPEKFYKCSECSKSFKMKDDLREHIQNYSCMSNKPHLLCDHCPFRTRRKSALVTHIKSHFVDQTATHQQALILLGNKKHDRFECENCGKAFGRWSNLDCHKKVCKSKISAQN